jgi:cysteine-S-conjugate beta-lyase
MKKISPETASRLRGRSRMVHLGHDFDASKGFVNVPAFRGSTVLFEDVETYGTGKQRFTYGTHGTPTTEALQEAWNDLAGAAGTVLVPSGLAAIVVALMAALQSGDHVLVTDSVYFPTRRFCENGLKRMGVETTYYDPQVGAGIAELIRPDTRAIFTEAPGSQSLEMQDIPAIVAAARAREICVIMDNTWATPIFFPAHAHGVDISIEAGTKYLSGHSDLLLGLASANAEWWPRLHRTVDHMAIPPGPEDVFLALRGLRTLDLRLREAERQALAFAQWLETRPEVQRVIHPALPNYAGHEIWKRDFHGSSGLFSLVLQPAPQAAVAALVGSLELFGLGASWGGYESLVIPFDCTKYRTATQWAPGGPTLRLSIGLEDIEDLKEDFERGLAAFREKL